MREIGRKCVDNILSRYKHNFTAVVIFRVLQNQRLTRLAEEPSVALRDSVPRSKLDSDLFVLSVSIPLLLKSHKPNHQA